VRNLMNQNPDHDGNELNPLRKSVALDVTAKIDFETALRKGFWRSVISWFTRSQNDLLPFDQIRQSLPVRGQHDIGNQQVELDMIVGSIGRYQDFDRAFLPRHTNTRGRWESIDKAHLQDISLPPIELYKVGSVYFVKDGNHRVSVARERGQAFIDAYVTEIDVPFPIDETSNIEEIIRKTEAVGFAEKTHLKEIRPDADIQFTVPGGCEQLLEHIAVHRYYMGEKRRGRVHYKEAVANWYDDVYLPLARVIRQHKILDSFPGRTEADLYLWIIEHLYYLREEFQAEVSLEEAAAHFTDEYSKKPFSRLINFLRRVTRMMEED
jgi:hypothetical protein